MGLTVEGLRQSIVAFRRSRWFRVFYVGVLGVVAAGLFYFTGGGDIGACLGIILIPVAVLVIPYWLGERSLKAFAINAAPIFAIALVLVTAFQTQSVLAQGRPALSSGVAPTTPNANLPSLSLWNGTVDPYSGPSPGQTYTFTVRLKAAPGVNASRVNVYLNLSQLNGLSGSSIPSRMVPYANTTNGTWYAATRQLSPAVYLFYFYANDGRGNQTLSTFVFEPLAAPWPTHYGFWLEVFAYEMIFPISFYFIIIFMYWYTVRTRKLRTRMLEAKKAKGAAAPEEAEKETRKPLAGPGEKTKKVAAFTCTNCGADVTEDDEKCPKCGAVFED